MTAAGDTCLLCAVAALVDATAELATTGASRVGEVEVAKVLAERDERDDLVVARVLEVKRRELEADGIGSICAVCRVRGGLDQAYLSVGPVHGDGTRDEKETKLRSPVLLRCGGEGFGEPIMTIDDV